MTQLESNKNITNNKRVNKKVPSIFSRIFFTWIFPLFYNGYRRDLEECDLPPIKSTYCSKAVGEKLERKWLEEEEAAKAEGRPPSVTRTIVKVFWWHLVPGGVLQFASMLFRIAGPLLFSRLLKYWSKESPIDRQTAICYAVGMVVTNVLTSVFYHHGLLLSQQCGMLLRIATSSLMFRKVMRMDCASFGTVPAGTVVNILSNDLQKFDQSFTYINSIWIVPIQVAIILYIGYRQAGVAAVIGFVVMMLTSLPFQGIIAKLIGKARFHTTKKTDARVKLMNEIISGVQVIKMYAWEKPFEKLVQEKRKDELSGVKVATTYKILITGFLVFNERLAIFITVLAYTLFGNSLSARMIYPIQQLMVTMRINITVLLPLLLSFMAELRVTMSRVQHFLLLKDRPDLVNTLIPARRLKSKKEYNNSSITAISYKEAVSYTNYDFRPDEIIEHSLVNRNSDPAVELKSVSASWTADPNVLTLSDISVQIPKGKLTAIIGPVGAGKSSILNLILNELPVLNGEVKKNGKVSYSSQDAWLLTNTVRENITFGLPFEDSKYRRVCKACALEQDFYQFPFGDQTLVGERGVLLSGGQRARINLARAVYTKADIYLLDDPLSAVDANVGRQLFEGCINGYLRGTTRILVTHQVHFLKAADFILILNEGKLEASGTYEDLISMRKDVAKILESHQENKDTTEENNYTEAMEVKERQLRIRSTSKSKMEDLPKFEAQKIASEERKSGIVHWDVVKEYFLSGSHWSFVTFTFVLIVAASASAGACDYWVSYWSNQMSEREKLGSQVGTGLHTKVGEFTIGQYLMVHGCLVAAGVVLTNLRALPFVKMCSASSSELHRRMFSTVLRATMHFFGHNSSGRILNRFVKDVGIVDDSIPREVFELSQISCNIAVLLVLNAIVLHWSLVPTTVLALISYFCVKVYLRGAQDMKRLESTSKSPIFDMVTSSIRGLPTVRAYGAQGRLVDQFDKYQDIHSSAWNATISSSQGFATYVDMVSTLYLTIMLFTFLFIDVGDNIAVGDVGLALTSAAMLVQMLQYSIRNAADLIAQLTSVERVSEYIHIPMEENISKGVISSPASWPTAGRIQFEDVSLRYNLDEAPVLKNINMELESGSKIGVVGRTGAGKSSLISAIFRFAHVDGKIIIDGIDTSLISKQELRSKISIIPQDPVLFSATVRYNLDPFNLYDDHQLWRALEQVDLKSTIQSLDHKVTEGGANFSVGQRQLMCLARAVLRANRILIMDEATANVDPQTDEFIQQTIRRQFAACTVLTIAHRLNTIMDSDRVLVLEKGEVVEFDHPYLLLSKPDGRLSFMVRETGHESYGRLYQTAKRCYEQLNKG